MPDDLPSPLPDGYRTRPATPDDLPAIADLIETTDRHDVGDVDYLRDELEQGWRTGDVDPEAAWLVETADGTGVAYIQTELHPGFLADGAGWVHPEHRGRGIGRLLIRLVERRAGELRGVRDTSLSGNVGAWINHQVEDAHPLLRDEGYRHVRSFYRMAIDLDESPPAPPDWPDGVRVRAFRPGEDDAATHEAMEESFAEHWGHARRTLDEWRRRRLERPGFDPSLWHLAVAEDDGRIAGASLCDVIAEEHWVSTLGVVKEWRGRGLGMALLRHSFVEFHRRGTRRVFLGVDAENTTGAIRLYERAGMHIDRQYDRYEKTLA